MENKPDKTWQQKVNAILANTNLMKKYRRWMQIKAGDKELYLGEREEIEKELAKHL